MQLSNPIQYIFPPPCCWRSIWWPGIVWIESIAGMAPNFQLSGIPQLAGWSESGFCSRAGPGCWEANTNALVSRVAVVMPTGGIHSCTGVVAVGDVEGGVVLQVLRIGESGAAKQVIRMWRFRLLSKVKHLWQSGHSKAEIALSASVRLLTCEISKWTFNFGMHRKVL
jgi:hypothetical protein